MAHKVAVINGKQPSGGVGGVSDSDLSNIGVNFLTAGITRLTDYQITQQGTPNMSVLVASGKAYVFKPDSSNVYVCNLDANANVTIANNSSGNPRIDVVVIKIDLAVTPNNNADNVATLVVVQGTPAGSPTAPSDSAIQTAVGAGNPFYRLSDVTVANGAVSITNANIADKRSGVQVRVLNGYIRFNTSTSKLQFSNDGTTYKDIGAGSATPTFTVVGTLTTGTDLSPLLIAPFPITIKKAFARVKTTPTGAALILDINKNGTSIWNTNQGNRLQIAAAATSGSQTTFDTSTLAEGDYLTLDIDQIGSTVAGADLTAELYCEAT